MSHPGTPKILKKKKTKTRERASELVERHFGGHDRKPGLSRKAVIIAACKGCLPPTYTSPSKELSSELPGGEPRPTLPGMEGETLDHLAL